MNRLNKIERYCKGGILEIGCGFGEVISYLHKYNLEATEIDKERLIYAKKRFPNINIYDKDIFKQKWNKKYDTILLLGVLEQIDLVPSQALKHLKMNLREEGRVIFEVPNTNSLIRRLKCLFGLEPIDSPNSRNYQFTMKRVKEMINQAGYKIVYLRGTNQERIRGLKFWVPSCLSRNYFGVIEKAKKPYF